MPLPRVSKIRLFDNYQFPRNNLGFIICVNCTFTTKSKISWLRDQNSNHRIIFNELVEDLLKYLNLFDEAIEKIQDDDDIDPKSAEFILVEESEVADQNFPSMAEKQDVNEKIFSEKLDELNNKLKKKEITMAEMMFLVEQLLHEFGKN